MTTYTTTQMAYIDSVAGAAHQSAIDIIVQLEQEVIGLKAELLACRRKLNDPYVALEVISQKLHDTSWMMHVIGSQPSHDWAEEYYKLDQKE